MPYAKSKSRALLAIAAGASGALVACGSSGDRFLGSVGTTPPDASEDAQMELCTGANPCGLIAAAPDASLDATCDGCGIVSLPADAGPDAADAGEGSPDAADDDAQDQ